MRVRWTVHPPLQFVDGAPYSTLFGDVFKSRHGAMQEAEQVFLQGCAIRDRWRDRPRHTVLELGFGLGVNFLSTLLAWRADPRRCARLDYVAIEKHPLAAADLALGLDWLCRSAGSGQGSIAADPLMLAARQLRAGWPLLSHGTHRLRFDGGAVTLLLIVDDAALALPEAHLAADSLYLDGFSPTHNPQLWQGPIFKGLARLSRRGARLASFSSAPLVRDGLSGAGFQIELAPGFAFKRRRLQAVYAPRWHTFAEPPPPPEWPARRAIVIGAGLAGCATARRLASRGWQVDVFDAGAAIAGGGSSQPVGAEHPHASADDNLLARLTRAAWGLSRSDPSWHGDGAIGARSGKLVLAVGEPQAQAQQRTAAVAGLAPDYLRAVDRAEAIELSRWPWLRASGALCGALWFADAMTLSPRLLCRHWLGIERGGSNGSSESGNQDNSDAAINVHLQSPVRAIERIDSGWQVCGDDAAPMAQAPVLIVANAACARALLRLVSIDLNVRGGQTGIVRSSVGAPRSALGGDAYLCPIDAQRFLIGATFEDPAGPMPGEQADASNLQRLAATLGTALPDGAFRIESRHAGARCSTRDRLPVIGAVPDEAAALAQRGALLGNVRLPLPVVPGLYANFAYGARGLLWSVLAAELLVARIEGDALPLSGELSDAVDPNRYLRRWLRAAAP